LRADLSGLPRAGETFAGKYRIDRVLGSGATGVVFAATHLRLGERVAIKMLLPEWRDEPMLAERFAREGRASAAIRSEHSVRILDVDECDGRPYLVLEYLEGKDLRALVAELGTLSVVSAIDFVLQACEAIAEAHVLGAIHRDLKPANLFLTHRSDGSPCVKVLDFGISKVGSRAARTSGFHPLGAHARLGSPHYMSPEQMMSADDVDVRTDIWSLGAIVHELLAGSPPFDGETITVLCARVAVDPPPALTRIRRDVPRQLEAVVLRCLEKDPSRRYANVAELSRALSEFGSPAALASAEKISRVVEGGIERGHVSLERDSQSMSREVSSADLPRPMRRPIGGYALAAVAVLALVGGAGWKVAKQAGAIRAAVYEASTAASVPPTTEVAPLPTPPSIASTTGALVPTPTPTTVAPAAEPHAAVIPPHHAHHGFRTVNAPANEPQGIFSPRR
jgi:serine/threonine-protein kinase